MFKPSHYLVRVTDLKQAVRDYQAAGFTVVWGSDAAKAHNAFIHFSKGGFIELFDPTVPGIAGRLQKVIAFLGARTGMWLFVRLERWIKARGLCDFALETTLPLAEAAIAVQQRGVTPSKPRKFSRRRADGVSTHWHLCAPTMVNLPFLMGPYNPPEQITPEQTNHDNGANEILGIEIATPNPKQYATELGKLLETASIDEQSLPLRVESEDFTFYLCEANRDEVLSLVIDHPPSQNVELHGLTLRKPLH